MIEYLKGPLAEVTPTSVVIDTASGVGYVALISLNSFEKIHSMKGEVRLLIHEVIREDSWTLYGFIDSEERELFRLLIGVSGVGPGTALLILSSIKPEDLRAVITSGDHTLLKAVKGIGAKTAQRIIVDLKDKIKPSDDTLLSQPSAAPALTAVQEEALAAMVALGFPRPQSQKVLRRIFDAQPDIKVEAAIKKALGMM
ncbi:MAG: Holliday junction branch migration protein RuvA [Muribaculaceae bacterium]|nr:Holliday junction branch migration protein RuvA [Muribaculaceae bacterium]